MTSQPKRCNSITTSLPSSPEPSSITRLAEGASGVPIVVMFVGLDHECESAEDCIARNGQRDAGERLRPYQVSSKCQRQRDADAHPFQPACVFASFERCPLHE